SSQLKLVSYSAIQQKAGTAPGVKNERFCLSIHAQRHQEHRMYHDDRNSYTGRPTQGVWRDLPFRIRLGLRYGSAHKERTDSGDRHSAREAAHASRSYTSRTSLELKPVMGITWLSEAVPCVFLAGPHPQLHIMPNATEEKEWRIRTHKQHARTTL